MASTGKVITGYRDELKGAIFAFAGMNFMVDPADLPIEGGQCVDIKNCDVDSFANVSRRKGYTRYIAGNITTSWANTSKIFCVKANRICRVINNVVTEYSNSPTVLSAVEFKQVNDIVVFSDGLVIGCIVGDTLSVFSAPSAINTDQQIIDRITNNYPANFQASQSNFDVDAFRIGTYAGLCLEFYNGRLYMAVGNFVLCTNAFDIESQDLRYNVVAGFPEPITMVARVNDGLYVATASQTYFLHGAGPKQHGAEGDGFRQTQIMKYGAIYGTVARFQNDLIKDAQGKNTTCLWASTIGAVAGNDSGAYQCLSLNQITMPTGSTGTAIVREADGVYQYIVCFNVGSDLFINIANGVALDQDSLSDTWIVNTVTGSHSRYTNFAFNSFFKFNEKYYGSNALGIYELDGDNDFQDEDGQLIIDAHVLTPVTDLNKRELKKLIDGFLNIRAHGDMIVQVTTNEKSMCAEHIVRYNNKNGIARRRIKIPRGSKVSSVQFKIMNSRGSYFKLFDFEVSAITLQRTI